MLIRGSSSAIVPTPWLSAIVALEALLRFTKNVSFDSPGTSRRHGRASLPIGDIETVLWPTLDLSGGNDVPARIGLVSLCNPYLPIQVLGAEAERNPRRLPAGQSQQPGGQRRDDHVGRLEGEGGAQGGGVYAGAGGEQRAQSAHHRGGLIPQRLGAGGGDHGLAGPDQEGVLKDAPQAG